MPAEKKFHIVETILHDKQFKYMKGHIQRMQQSARHFCYPFSKKKLETLSLRIHKQLTQNKRYLVRIVLDASGAMQWTHTTLPAGNTKECRSVLVAGKCVESHNEHIYHKTTYRPWYTAAMQKIKNGICYDVIHYNERGEVTEGARTNIFIKKNGMLYTPPLSCGVLPGILRAALIKKGKAKEAMCTLKDLYKAEDVFCGNSVRGLQRVKIQKQGSV